MEKTYEKYLFKSYKDEIENLTVDSIKQKLINFESYCEKKLNCDKFQARLRYDQISNQYYLSYSLITSRKFKVANILQDYLNKIRTDFQYVVIGVHAFRIYSGGVVGNKIFVDTMVSESWLEQNFPEYLEKFETKEY